MVEFRHDADIFRSKAMALVNPVNCLGVMGKGLAKQFLERFPEECRAYRAWCSEGLARIGEVCVTHTLPERPWQTYIIHFPTKDDWRKKSKLEYIARGLVALVERVHFLEIESVAVPALGCGEGGLAWPAVKALMIAHLDNDVEHTRWDVYPPHD